MSDRCFCAFSGTRIAPSPRHCNSWARKIAQVETPSSIMVKACRSFGDNDVLLKLVDWPKWIRAQKNAPKRPFIIQERLTLYCRCNSSCDPSGMCCAHLDAKKSRAEMFLSTASGKRVCNTENKWAMLLSLLLAVLLLAADKSCPHSSSRGTIDVWQSSLKVFFAPHIICMYMWALTFLRPEVCTGRSRAGYNSCAYTEYHITTTTPLQVRQKSR